VKDVTVKNLVINNLKSSVEKESYCLCTGRSCDVIYFNASFDKIFKKVDIKVPIWFKDDADPKIICYCNQVTEKEIQNVVLNENAKTVKDVIELTDAMKTCNCELNHPTGKCCSRQINETINKYL